MTGVLALICVSLTTGLGGADASRVQAPHHGTASNQRIFSGSGSPPRAVNATLLIPALEGNPFRSAVSLFPLLAGTTTNVPAPRTATRPRGTHTSPTGLLWQVTGGQGDVLPPASQARSARATIFGSSSGPRGSAPQSAYNDSPPPSAGGSQGQAVATLAGVTPAGLLSGVPAGSATAAVAALDHAIHSPTLRLERVVDSQTLASTVPLVEVVHPNDPTTDLVAEAQRPPAAAGLELVHVRRAATSYQALPTATPTASPTATWTPIPTATWTPVPPATWTPVPATSTPIPVATATTAAQRATAPQVVERAVIITTPTPTWVPPTATSTPLPPPPATPTPDPTAVGAPRNAQWQWFTITGYIATGSRTATGTWPVVGRTVAVDPRVIPLGSTVYIQGLGVFRAEDTGGAVIGNHIDVFVASTPDAYAITGQRLVSWTPPG